MFLNMCFNLNVVHGKNSRIHNLDFHHTFVSVDDLICLVSSTCSSSSFSVVKDCFVSLDSFLAITVLDFTLVLPTGTFP